MHRIIVQELDIRTMLNHDNTVNKTTPNETPRIISSSSMISSTVTTKSILPRINTTIKDLRSDKLMFTLDTT